VDEAAQAVELTCLIPLRLHCPRLVLIGDPMQLPATVLSPAAASLGYDCSLFERLSRCGREQGAADVACGGGIALLKAGDTLSSASPGALEHVFSQLCVSIPPGSW
jgi:hypothetical protein